MILKWIKPEEKLLCIHKNWMCIARNSWEDSMTIFIFTHVTAVKNIRMKLQKLELYKLPAPTILGNGYGKVAQSKISTEFSCYS